MHFQVYSLDFLLVHTEYESRQLHQPVSFSISPGKWTVLQGESGLGKTSLLRAAMGFNECVRGRISINDEDVNAGLINRLRKVCGYLPQRPYLGEGKVLGQINDLLPESGQVQTALELCRDFGLPERILQAPAERLSGGELQRLTLSLLLSREPQLLMLDEPSAALDGFSRKRLIDILQEHKIGGLMISHDEYLTEALADSTVTLEAIA